MQKTSLTTALKGPVRTEHEARVRNEAPFKTPCAVRSTHSNQTDLGPGDAALRVRDVQVEGVSIKLGFFLSLFGDTLGRHHQSGSNRTYLIWFSRSMVITLDQDETF